MSKGFLPRRLPLRLIRFSGSHPKAMVLLALVLMAISIFLAKDVRIKSDILALIPEDNEAVNDFRSTIERFGSTDFLLVALELEDPEDLEYYMAYADIYAEVLRESEHISWLEYRVQDFVEAGTGLMDRFTLFLTSEELEAVFAKMDPARIDQVADELAGRVRSPLDAGFKELITLDPFNLMPILSERIKNKEFSTRFDQETGYLIDDDHTMLLMLVKPVNPAADIKFSKKLAEWLPEAEAEAAEILAEEGFDRGPPKTIYGGGYMIAVEDSRQIVNDMIWGTSTALLGVILLFTFAFGRPVACVISAVPLLSGMVLTFGMVGLTVGSLNAATSAFAALLIGLGVDFIIVLYSRYLEERQAGTSHELALDALAENTSVGVFLGAVTTAATFFAFLISGFRGLSELGLLTGTGIMVLVLTVFVLLPALLTLFEAKRAAHACTLRSFGLERMCAFAQVRPRLILISGLVMTVICGYFATGVYYDTDVLNMRATNNPGLVNQTRIMNAFGIRFTPLMVRVDGATENEAIAEAQTLMEELRPLLDGENLGRLDAAVTWLPSQDMQAQVIAGLEQRDFDAQAYKQQFRAAIEARGLNPRPFEKALEATMDALTLQETMSLSELTGESLSHLLGRYLAEDKNEGEVSTMIYAYPPAGKWRKGFPPPLLEVVQQHDNALLTGPQVISNELKAIVWRDARIAFVLGTLIVFIFLAWDLGGLKAGAFALVPLIVGLVWMVGIMSMLDLHVNFMNIFVFTMIIGIGVDYGIHLIHRWQETGGDGEALVGTSKAIMIASLTTIIGFGSLAFSHYPGLRSMGIVAILGALGTAVISITILPAMLQMISKPKRKEP